MAFTYDLSSSDPTIVDLSHVRLQIGDTTENDGVLPDGGNFTDEEIIYSLGENDGDVQATVSALSGVLARRWAAAVDVTVGPRREALSQAAQRWQTFASNAGGDGARSFVADTVRSDGYSTHADGAEY